MEVGSEGGFQGGFGGEVLSDATGEAVMAAEAEGAAATCELVEAVKVEGEEGMRLVDGLLIMGLVNGRGGRYGRD